jgi:hypothetical protein
VALAHTEKGKTQESWCSQSQFAVASNWGRCCVDFWLMCTRNTSYTKRMRQTRVFCYEIISNGQQLNERFRYA